MVSKYKKIKLKDGSTIDEHRLIWMEYYGGIPDGYVVHHKDEDGFNNDINNLELMTRKEHARYHMKGKKLPKKHRNNIALSLMNNGNRKFFTDEEVREIRRLKLEGLSNRKIAKIFNKGKDSINNIVNGKTYLDII